MMGPAGAGRGGLRQAASALSPSGVAAAAAPSVALGEVGLGQAALTPPSSPAVRRTASPSVVAAPAPSVVLGEGGLGQAALTPLSSPAVRRTASPSAVAAPAPFVALGEGGLGQAALTPPSSSAVRRSEPLPSVPVAMGLGLGHLSEGHGSPLPPPPVSLVDPSWVSARGVTREEVVAFGGIPDPASTGRRMSARIQELPEVDDMQQRCAMRAAKLHDAAISTGYFPSHGRDPFMVATHSDGGQGAFGYWIYPLGDGSSGYLQPVWMAVM
ncbi:mucin-1-like [Triticum aestivum]|uniref:mucin-1-like n=1 Tax=Triticum aestivum TaxID=4565 RepID=UPI001D00614F|nr:mucin-1-like [Triticum aestivum]